MIQLYLLPNHDLRRVPAAWLANATPIPGQHRRAWTLPTPPGIDTNTIATMITAQSIICFPLGADPQIVIPVTLNPSQNPSPLQLLFNVMTRYPLGTPLARMGLGTVPQILDSFPGIELYDVELLSLLEDWGNPKMPLSQICYNFDLKVFP